MFFSATNWCFNFAHIYTIMYQSISSKKSHLAPVLANSIDLEDVYYTIDRIIRTVLVNKQH